MRQSSVAPAGRPSSQSGFPLLELLLVSAPLVVVTGATLAFLEVATRSPSRDPAYGHQITATQSAVAPIRTA
jgi:hypothetical protein